MVLLPWLQYVRHDGFDKTLRLPEELNWCQGAKAWAVSKLERTQTKQDTQKIMWFVPQITW